MAAEAVDVRPTITVQPPSFGQRDGPVDAAENIRWTRECFAAMPPFLERGVYVNDLGEDAEDRVWEDYGANYVRLAAAKAQCDPTNLFRVNHNIRPPDRARPACSRWRIWRSCESGAAAPYCRSAVALPRLLTAEVGVRRASVWPISSSRRGTRPRTGGVQPPVEANAGDPAHVGRDGGAAPALSRRLEADGGEEGPDRLLVRAEAH